MAVLCIAIGSILVGSAHCQSSMTLNPITSHSDIVPSTKVDLLWGRGDTSLVNVSLSMKNPTVVLENIDGIASVDCSADSVAVAFNSSDVYITATSLWSLDGNFVLITNHLGDCDLENERGFYLVSSTSLDNETLTITASSGRTNVAGTAASTEIFFSRVPISPTSRRDISIDNDTLSVSAVVSVPDDTTLYTYAPYVTVTADSAEIDVDVVFTGYLNYQILNSTLESFYFDIDTTISADLTLTADVEAAYSNSFLYSPSTLTYSLVDIPGIISLGPALAFAIGVDIDAEAAVTITGSVGAQLSDGNVHLDFVNYDDSTTSGWVPTYSTSLKIAEEAQVSVNPYIGVTMEIAFDLLDGLLDLSAGVTAEPKFVNDFVLTAQQDVGDDGSVSQPTSDSACPQGVAIHSEFLFSVTAFVTEFWSDMLYNVTFPIADECYSWQ